MIELLSICYLIAHLFDCLSVSLYIYTRIYKRRINMSHACITISKFYFICISACLVDIVTYLITKLKPHNLLAESRAKLSISLKRFHQQIGKRKLLIISGTSVVGF